MRVAWRGRGPLLVTAKLRRHAVAVPGAAAIAVRPNTVTGQSQALVVCHLGICPLHVDDHLGHAHLGPPLTLRNHVATRFDIKHIHDAVYDDHSGLVMFARNASLYGMDARNRIVHLAGDDDDAGLNHDGPACDARFVGAQRLATDGSGITYIRDRCSSSRNGFCLRAMHEPPADPSLNSPSEPDPADPADLVLPSDSVCNQLRGSGHRAVVTVNIGTDVGPHILTYDTLRRRLLFVLRGRAIHQLHPMGATLEILGTDEAPPYNATASAAAATASASASANDSVSDGDFSEADGPEEFAFVPAARYKLFTNIQSIAVEPASGNVYILDGTTGCTTALRVLRPDGCLDTLAARLRVGPRGSARWPRLAVLPRGRLAVFGTSSHEILVLEP